MSCNHKNMLTRALNQNGLSAAPLHFTAPSPPVAKDKGPGLYFGVHGQFYLLCREPAKVANGTTSATFSPTVTI
jgi:hypothetical protein